MKEFLITMSFIFIIEGGDQNAGSVYTYGP